VPQRRDLHHQTDKSHIQMVLSSKLLKF